jgi:hypothetical protein
MKISSCFVLKSECYTYFHVFLHAPPSEMAPYCRKLRAPRVTLGENMFQALVDPPNISNEDHDNEGDEFVQGTYGNSLTNVA